MKEQDLIDLGFEKQQGEFVGSDDTYYYYTLDIGKDFSPFCLISNASDELDNGQWFVEIFDYNSFRFVSRYQLEQLLEVLKYAQTTSQNNNPKIYPVMGRKYE